ncbi:hypothetical protein BP5796_12127 [Coleophoma crateriformis]|uniref:Alpha/beta hydrolase fold-3 domain-containing protein n=1 Tax=Coleophoma crateriformis TaxID=565419 RepID=A0A3D8QBH8_9HELO|nr:hypothetical protein BP5796_12127 [Coleophoma crateriformis]
MEAPMVSTDETYKNVVAAEGLPVDVESLDGYKLCWLGPRTGKKVIVYACGGALVMHANNAHIQWLVNGYKAMKANGQDVSIAILAYGLCPDVPYPGPIRHMVGTVKHLLKSRAPETISFSGDSAGGLLIIATLLHHNHPHPNIESYDLPPTARFDETLLISPGGPVDTGAASLHQDPQTDVINFADLQHLWGIITSTVEPGLAMPNAWMAPSTAPEEWWKDLPIGKITIFLGDLEILRDDILKYGALLKKYHDKEVVIQDFPGEYHEQAIIDVIQGVPEEKGSAKAWKAWFQNFKS